MFITGHSLGAARAALYAYYRLANHLPVYGVYLFGCPNPGNKIIGKLLSSTSVMSYKNRRDPVTSLPINMEFLFEEYVPVAPFNELNEAAASGDSWGLFSDHHSQLYQQGIGKLTFAPTLKVTPKDAIDSVVNMSLGFGTWTWTNFINGQYCATSEVNGLKMVTFRGSTTKLDWINDLEFHQVDVFGARASHGFWDGIVPILQQLDQSLV